MALHRVARRDLLACLVVSPLLAGCSQTPSETKYYVRASEVQDAPSGATIIDSVEGNLDAGKAVRQAIADARREGHARVEVNESKYERLNDVFRDRPHLVVKDSLRTESPEFETTTDGRRVLFVSDGDSIVVVWLERVVLA
ncbi:hypothetical protein [Haladaptatus sp. NG-SE-30]